MRSSYFIRNTMFTAIENFSRFSTRLLSKSNNLHSIAKYSTGIFHNTTSYESEQQANVQSTTQERFGQPTTSTHPHLLKDGEITPGLQKDEFKSRRNKLMEKISKSGQQVATQVVVIPSASKAYMSDKIPYVFRQNTDFLYFTGCQEPDSVLLLIIKGEEHSSVLFLRPKDSHAELWDGPRTGVIAAPALFDINQVLPVEEFDRFIISFLTQHKKSLIWYDQEDVIQPGIHQKFIQHLKSLDVQGITCPKTLIHQVRAIKSHAEVNLMKRSCEIASAAISKTIEISRPGISEHELFATVDYECRMKGADFLAYPPVVAGGKNANTIHYVANNQIVHGREMVLMDAGCEYHGYTSDITRTWPIDGSFTCHQKILYEIVLELQKTLIAKLMEMPSLDMLYRDMCSLLGSRLQAEGLIPKTLGGNDLLKAAYSYCPHHVSHYLGMDVHDTSRISRSIRVQAGMIVTVEPGIYVNPENEFAPPEFKNLGIRIEDDILIQENDIINLSEKCPKEVDEIEELAQHNQIR